MKTKIVSLDIETVFDTEAQAKLPAFAVIKRRHGRWPLHRIAAASLIIVERAHSSGQPVIRSLGLHLGMANERDMLRMIEANMPRPDNDDEDLVTFNGAAHDLPILRQRALALGLFEIPKIAGWNQGNAARRHRDVMRYLSASGATKAALVDVAAGIGLSAKQAIQGTSAERLHSAGRHPELLRACEQDSVATLLVHGHLEALEQNHARPLLELWKALIDWIQAPGYDREHLDVFFDHPIAQRACRKIGD